MTRKDEIAVASCAYGVKGSSIDFEAGARWADKNPKSPLVRQQNFFSPISKTLFWWLATLFNKNLHTI